MQIPYRKPGKFSLIKSDPVMTEDKFSELKNKLEKLLKSRPAAAAEVSRLAELGDFSENAEYQHAKGRLRGINSAILTIDGQLTNAEVLRPVKKGGKVEIGNVVTIEVDGVKKVYQILGSTESNPKQGVISRHSPIGEALLGKKVGDTVVVKLANREVKYKILKIE